MPQRKMPTNSFDDKSFLEVRKITLKAKRLSQQLFAGKYHSAFKGTGMSFSEVRTYAVGDDTRNIDWNVTARYNEPYVKLFNEEREMTVVLMLDVSASNNFGTNPKLKKQLILELAATLAFSAIFNNDRVGVLFFSDVVEKFIPPKKGKAHILRIIQELITFKPVSKTTNLNNALDFLINAVKKRSNVFLLSDFMQLPQSFKQTLTIAAQKHDITALHIADTFEPTLIKQNAFMFAHDIEDNTQFFINLANPNFLDKYAKRYQLHLEQLNNLLLSTKIDVASFNATEDYVTTLTQLLAKRTFKF